VTLKAGVLAQHLVVMMASGSRLVRVMALGTLVIVHIFLELISAAVLLLNVLVELVLNALQIPIAAKVKNVRVIPALLALHSQGHAKDGNILLVAQSKQIQTAVLLVTLSPAQILV
jgi:hypothetical protein